MDYVDLKYKIIYNKMMLLYQPDQLVIQDYKIQYMNNKKFHFN